MRSFWHHFEPTEHLADMFLWSQSWFPHPKKLFAFHCLSLPRSPQSHRRLSATLRDASRRVETRLWMKSNPEDRELDSGHRTRSWRMLVFFGRGAVFFFGDFRYVKEFSKLPPNLINICVARRRRKFWGFRNLHIKNPSQKTIILMIFSGFVQNFSENIRKNFSSQIQIRKKFYVYT